MGRSMRVIWISIALSLLGPGGLFALDYSSRINRDVASPPTNGQPTRVDHDPWWHYLLFHLLALIGSVGLVGLTLELISRRELVADYIRKMKEGFDEDPELARLLSDEARQRRVENTLKAHLGEEGGKAIYYAIVSRYLTEKRPFRPFRYDITYEATIDDLQEDAELGEGRNKVILSTSDYYRLTVSWSFRRAYEKYNCIGCILVQENEELDRWFDTHNCLYREVVEIAKADIGGVTTFLEKHKGAREAKAIDELFKVKVSIDGRVVEVSEPSVENSGKSARFPLKTLRRVSGELALFQIETSAVLARSARSHPFHIVEPSSNPRIVFNYPAADIKNVRTAPFFATKNPFQPVIRHAENQRRVEVTLRDTDRTKWVFPNSGVIFMWDNS